MLDQHLQIQAKHIVAYVLFFLFRIETNVNALFVDGVVGLPQLLPGDLDQLLISYALAQKDTSLTYKRYFQVRDVLIEIIF